MAQFHNFFSNKSYVKLDDELANFDLSDIFTHYATGLLINGFIEIDNETSVSVKDMN